MLSKNSMNIMQEPSDTSENMPVTNWNNFGTLLGSIAQVGQSRWPLLARGTQLRKSEQVPFEESFGRENAVWRSEVVGSGEPQTTDPLPTKLRIRFHIGNSLSFMAPSGTAKLEKDCFPRIPKTTTNRPQNHHRINLCEELPFARPSIRNPALKNPRVPDVHSKHNTKNA